MAPSRRERELARRRYERQAAKRAEQARKKRKRTIVTASVAAGVIVIAIVVVAIVVSASGGKGKSTLAAATPTPATSASASPTPTASGSPSSSVSPTPSATASGADARALACYLKAPETHTTQTYKTAPPLTVDPSKNYTMKVYTPCGLITAALDVKDAPTTVNSFAFLASKGFFNGTECNRVTTSPTFSVLQCGDPTGTGMGGPGYSFKDENLAASTYTRGTLAMANSGPNTNGSQFFLVDKDSTSLPKNYTVFGHITSGIGALDRIVDAGVAPGGSDPTDGKPAKRVFINSLDVAAS